MRWEDDAACRGMNPELFYPGQGESVAEARAVCEECPVRRECLSTALARPEMFGVWGGLAERGRRQVRNSRAGGPS